MDRNALYEQVNKSGVRRPSDVHALSQSSIVIGEIGQVGAIQALAPSLRMKITPINIREASEIDRRFRHSHGFRMVA
jgi:hypothetical protein